MIPGTAFERRGIAAFGLRISRSQHISAAMHFINLLFRANNHLSNLLFRAYYHLSNLPFRAKGAMVRLYQVNSLRGVRAAMTEEKDPVVLKRKLYDRLLEWKNKSRGTSALMINGARRVGKSFLCRQFAENEYESYIMIDFGNAPVEILDLFKYDSSNLDLFFAKLSAFYSTSLHKRSSVIIFDEVQQYPRARQLIKYLVEDGRYDYIETGSLIRIRKNVQDIIIPSEEEHVEMFPLDLEEFLWALGDFATMPLVRSCFNNRTPLGQALHRKVMNDFRQYVIVGGMPQAVLAYLRNKEFESVDAVKRQIITLYRNDVSKFAAGYEDKVIAVLRNAFF